MSMHYPEGYQYLNDKAARFAGVEPGIRKIQETGMAELVWRDFSKAAPDPYVHLWRAQDWGDGTSPDMRGTSYTLLGKPGLIVLGLVVPGGEAKKLGEFRTLEDAKRAAQADFEAHQ